jgi:GNAT superfamily N-acetyltransferase
VTITREELDSPIALALIGALNAELSARYPEPGANNFELDPEEVGADNGAFLVAYVDGQAAACGAVRRIGAGVAEIKRMYTRPEARGRGLARALLTELESTARTLGVRRLVLETGVRQPDALALYRRAGFVPVEPFGGYSNSPLSVCLGKEL